MALSRDAAGRAAASRQDAAAARLAALTPKEREVLERIARGATNKDIAAELGLSVRAVEDRRARLMKKMDAKSVADLVWVCSATTSPPVVLTPGPGGLVPSGSRGVGLTGFIGCGGRGDPVRKALSRIQESMLERHRGARRDSLTGRGLRPTATD